MELSLFIIVLAISFFYYQKTEELKRCKNENNNLKKENEHLIYLQRKPIVVTTYDEPVKYDAVEEKKPKSKPKIKRNRENYPDVTQEDLAYFIGKKINKEYLYPRKDIENTSHYFYGKKCVITGDFETFDNRNEMAKLLWEVGADVDLGVGKNTTTVIIGDNPGPSKLIQAQDLGLEFVTENEFNDFFNI